MLSRRYRCSNPACSAVQAAVKKSMATSKGDGNIWVGEGALKRPITDAERTAMRRGDLVDIPARAIRGVVGGGGVSFEIDDAR